MKKIFTIITTVAVLAACKQKINPELEYNKNMVLVDTTGLYKSNVLTDVGDRYVISEEAAMPAKTRTNTSSSSVRSGSGNSAPKTTTAPVARKTTPKDKGWSHAAKGTAVGAGSGAILGAIVNKNNRGRGAIIGTVIGAGAGYVIGRSQDKKSGRVDRAKARKAGN